MIPMDPATGCSKYGGTWNGTMCQNQMNQPSPISPYTNSDFEALKRQVEQLQTMMKNMMVNRNDFPTPSQNQPPQQMIPPSFQQNQQQNGQGTMMNTDQLAKMFQIKPIFVCSFETMKRGDTSDQVKALQEILILEGYFKGLPTGFFGSKTFRALRNYQNDNNIKSIGAIESDTIQALNTSALENFPTCSQAGTSASSTNSSRN